MSKDELYLPDSSGIIYSYVDKADWTAAFRFEVDLDHEIQPDKLNEAIALSRKRFPTFFVQLKKDGALFKLCGNDAPLLAEPEQEIVCAPFTPHKEGSHLIRIGYNGCKVFVEVFHTVSDGHAALIFFQSLLICYYNLIGTPTEVSGEALDLNDTPTEEERSDAFLDIFKDGKSAGRFDTPAYQYAANAPRVPLQITMVSFPDNEVYAVAKQHDTSVGVLLASALLYALYLTQKKHTIRPIRISIPVDLRKMFPSKTLRNFSLYIIVGIKPREKNWTINDIIETVARQFEEQLTKENMLNMAYDNVKQQTMPLFVHLPVPLKRAALTFGYNFLGEKFFTTTISSFGRIRFAETLQPHIADSKFILGEAMVSRLNCTAVSVNGKNNFTFSAKVGDDSVQKMFTKVLNSIGISTKYQVRNNKTRQYEVK